MKKFDVISHTFFNSMMDLSNEITKLNSTDFEKGINGKGNLNKIYEEYIDNDRMSLFNNEFEYMIDEILVSERLSKYIIFKKKMMAWSTLLVI